MAATPKYILTERIAQGGMAEIHLGKIVGSDGFSRVCAFKRILPHYAQDKEFIQMFRQEAMVAKQLQNKNIVQVYDFVGDGQSFMLVMEFVDGQDLRSVLAVAEQARQRIPIEISVYVMMEVLSGLAFAHSALDVTGQSMNIIHRDISPQNVLISYDGDIKITDFGIAKVEDNSSNTQAGVLKGKFRYMSPEQAMGAEIDARSDLFAAGVVLYEMITMTRLFKGEDMAVLEQVRQCNIAAPSQVRNTKLPLELEGIIMKMLARDPSARYQTAKSAVKDLSRFLYSYRPDFFAGEVAEFMQALFRDRLSSSRERLRSTLALPVDAIGRATRGMDVGAPESIHSAVLDMSQAGLPQLNGNAAQALAEAGRAAVAARSQQVQEQNKRLLQARTKGKTLGLKMSRSKLSLEVDTSNLTRPPFGQTNTGLREMRTNPQIPAGRGGGQEVRWSLRTQATKRKNHWWIIALLLGLILLGGVLLAGRKNMIPYTVSLELNLSPPVPMRVDIVGTNGLNVTRMFEGPTTFSLENGNYSVRIFRPGFEVQRFSFSTSFFERTHRRSIVLEKSGLLGQLRMTTNPPGAEITSSDGFVRATSPGLLSFIPIGKTLELTIRHPRCAPFTYKERLPRSAEKVVLNRSIQLRDCR
jgi:serine/threonine protein kinase